MKKNKRLLAMIVALIMLFPSNVYAVPAKASPSAAFSAAAIEPDSSLPDVSEPVVRVQEDVGLRTANSDTYRMSDGSFECVVYAEDKYYPNEQDELVPIDNSLVAAEKGAAYQNAANVFSSAFSAKGKPTVDLSYQDHSISFAPVSAATSAGKSLPVQSSNISVGAVRNCAALAKLTATGSNTATYVSAFPNTDLVYIVENSGIKEYIILRDKNCANSFRFRLQLDGLTPQIIEGNPTFADANGNVVFALTDLFAVDSGNGATDKLTYGLQPGSGKGEFILTVTLDSAFLSDPARVFPVVIDPTIMISSLYTPDAYVCSNYPTTNYYSSTYLRTGKDTPFGIRRSYIQFDIPALPTNSLFQSASLDIEKESGVAPNLYAYRCTSSWSSSTITWNNKPGTTSSGSSPKATLISSTWYSITVTNIVKAWLYDSMPNYGFMLKDSNESSTDHWTTYYSSEAVSPHKPELNITYTIPPAAEISTNCLYYIKSNGKYLKSSPSESDGVSATFSTVATCSSEQSTELWYFEKVSAGLYRIESLGVRNASYAGRSRNMLTVSSASGTTGTLSLTARSETNDNQLWELHQVDNTYIIKSHAYPQLALSTAGTTPSLGPYVSAVRWSLQSRVTNDFYVGGYSGASAPYTINIIIEPSAVTGRWTESIFNCYTAWSDVSSLFTFRLYPHTYTGSYAAADCTIRVSGEDFGVNGLTAITYSSTGYNEDDWSLVFIELNIGTGESSCNTSNYTNTDREKAFLHELGHALKLMHPHETNNAWRPLSIMCQGAPSKNPMLPSRPSGYDIENLKRKW